MPAREFLDRCPTGVAADIIATAKAVAEAPPPRFGGGGQWHVMHGSMKGFHEVGVTGPGRRRYRLFCILERYAPGLGGPSVVLITGMDKPPGSGFSEEKGHLHLAFVLPETDEPVGVCVRGGGCGAVVADVCGGAATKAVRVGSPADSTSAKVRTGR
jgi:hypothetical protein